MYSKRALLRTAGYVGACIAALTLFALAVPRELLSLPVYVGLSVISVVYFARVILKDSANKERRAEELASKSAVSHELTSRDGDN